MSKLEVRLIRMDIPTPSGFFCTLYNNNTKLGVISSTEYDDPHNSLQVPVESLLKLKITSNTCLLGSVSFPGRLITESGCFWLPILPSGCSDYIDVLPEDIQSPKILLYFEIADEPEESQDELTQTKEKLEKISKSFEEFIKNAKSREMILLKTLEEKEVEVQDYLEKLNLVQNKAFFLATEKKKLAETLNRFQDDQRFLGVNHLKEELEMTRQELFKAESRNENLMKKLEEVQGEWNLFEEESKHVRESELMTQLMQLRHELDLKNQEISMLKLASPNILNEISNKPEGPENSEMMETVKHSKPVKGFGNVSCVENSLRNSFVLEEEPMHQSLFMNSRGVSPVLKENSRKTPELEKSKSSYKFGTISSNSKSKFLPLSVSRKTNKSVERKNK